AALAQTPREGRVEPRKRGFGRKTRLRLAKPGTDAVGRRTLELLEGRYRRRQILVLERGLRGSERRLGAGRLRHRIGIAAAPDHDLLELAHDAAGRSLAGALGGFVA